MRTLLEFSADVWFVDYSLYILTPITQTFEFSSTVRPIYWFVPPSFPRIQKLKKKMFIFFCSAQAQGLLCEEAGNYGDNVKYCGYCVHHYKKLVSHWIYMYSKTRL